MSRILSYLLALLLTAFTISAFCQEALTKVKIELKWFHQFQFAGIYMAKEKGFYKAGGLDVDILERNPKSNPVDDLLNNKVQFGISDSTIVKKRLEGKPVVILAAIYQHSPLVLISLAKNKLYSPLELKNKKVMYQAGIDDAIIVGMFINQGLKKDDFIFVPHTFNNDALLSNTADAMSAYMGNQTYFYQQKGHPLNIINPANYGLDFYGDILFTSETYFIKNKKTALAFKRATIKGWQYALNHIDESIDVIIQNYSKKKSREALLHEAKHTKSMIAPNLIEIGHINKSRIERIKSIYQDWYPILKLNELDGILYSDHINDNSNNVLYLISGIAALLFLLTIFSFHLATGWKKQGQIMTYKFSQTSKKLESFQDVILHKLDTTKTTESSEITFMSDSMIQNLGYKRDEIIGMKKIDLYMHKSPEILHETIRRSIKKHGLWEGELKLKMKNGQFRSYDCLVDEYYDSHGHRNGYISIHIDQTEKKEAVKRASIDSLTNIANRYALDKILSTEIKRADRYQAMLSIILIDIDNFKQINDTYGHNIGDEVIKYVAAQFKQNIRDVDFVGRWGGEEFLIICPETSLEGAELLANKIRLKISDGQCQNLSKITISGGIASYNHNEDTFSLLERADNALYEAKRNGRNQIKTC